MAACGQSMSALFGVAKTPNIYDMKIYCQFLVCTLFQHSVCCYVLMGYYIKCRLGLFNNIVLVSHLNKSLTFTVTYHYASFTLASDLN